MIDQSCPFPSTYITVSLNGGTNLLRPWGDCERGLALEAMVKSLLGKGGSSAHVLITGVSTAADQT